MNRSGFALIVVLWLTVILATLGTAGGVALNNGLRASGNRALLTRGRWAAEACLAIAEQRWVARSWTDSSAVDLGGTLSCRWHTTYPAAGLNLNLASRAELQALLAQLDVDSDSARRWTDSVVAARRRSPITDARMISSFGGVGNAVTPFITLEGNGTIDLQRAPPEVLGALSGFSSEAVVVVMSGRAAGAPPRTIGEISEKLSPTGRRSLAGHHPELAARLIPADLAVLRTEGWVGAHGDHPRQVLEMLVTLLPDRLAVVRKRIV